MGAVASKIAIPVASAPGDDRAISLEGREGSLVREYLSDSRAELGGHSTTGPDPVGATPSDDRAIGFERSESALIINLIFALMTC